MFAYNFGGGNVGFFIAIVITALTMGEFLLPLSNYLKF